MKTIVCLVLVLSLGTGCSREEGICVKHLEVPDYPRIALSARIQGTVTLSLTIAADGRVVSASGSGHPLLKSAAEANVRKWVFSGSKNASSVRQLTITYDYIITEGTEDNPRPEVVFDLPYRVEIRSNALPINV